jgi:hypothetical protein
MGFDDIFFGLIGRIEQKRDTGQGRNGFLQQL